MIWVEIGPACSAGASPIERWVVFRYMVVYLFEADEEIIDIEENL